jgi:hypothetical protein
MTYTEKVLELLTKIIKKEIKKISIPFCFVKAKVSRNYMEQGVCYVDVIILKQDGSVDDDFHAVRVEGYSLAIGTMVRLGFYYNSESQPYIDAVLRGGS